MTVSQLPGPIPATTRDREIEKWKRSHRLRVPEADTGPGTQPDTDARVCSDIVMPLYAAATTNNRNTVLELARGAALEQWAERLGIDPRRDAYGASGPVVYAGSGSTIPGSDTATPGDELRHESTGLRYEVVTTGTYVPGDHISIVGKDTGPDTNLPAGAQLKWTSPRPGCSDYALVGTGGLTGGRDKENDDEFLIRIQQEMQSGAASGNDAEYQQAVESTPNVAVQKSFTYAGILFAGTICYVFTVRPERSGGSRSPNTTQVGLVESHVAGEFPGDDGGMAGRVVDENADVVFEVDWSDGALGWADLAPWPAYYAVAPASGPGAVVVTASFSPTLFTLGTANDIYTGIRQPIVGQTLAFYDQAGFAWRRKRILSFTGTGPWVITCDTTNNASNTSYTPIITQRACPWSDSLPSILYTAPVGDAPATGLWSYFDTLGPGEQVATFYDEGSRQRRQPFPTASWPHRLTTRGMLDSITASEVGDIDVLEGDGRTPAIGTPGILSYQLLLRFVSAFPKTT